MVDQNWLKFIREQYPKGSRICLREMKDPYAPVEPGTMGTLNFIDDIGTFHVKWDNGRGLGLVLGEDSFTILPPETHLLKLYMPMTVDYYERNEWGDMEDEPITITDSEAAEYAPQIIAALLRERHPEEAEPEQLPEAPSPVSRLKDLLHLHWEDIHLLHKDVEIQPATIVELNEHTLTNAGKEAWADVLDAEVVKVYNGYYGLQMELDKVKPRRLEEFSSMLAGYCPVSDYEKWVMQEGDAPSQSPQMK